MKQFVFRAQAALDLRRQQDEDARRQLAIAQTAERHAEDALEAARRGLELAMRRCAEREAQGGVLHQILWYRNWIVLHRQAVQRCQMELAACQADVEQKRHLALVAHRKLRAIERFRERAWQQHLRTEGRREQKAIDELGTQRFLFGRTAGGQM